VLTRNKVAKKLAKRLRQLREAAGLSQEDLAFKSKLGRSYYWRLEQGTINVTLETIVRLCNALNVEIAELFEKK
jgi:transcriptional regulator with XRE-family HTH domain